MLKLRKYCAKQVRETGKKPIVAIKRLNPSLIATHRPNLIAPNVVGLPATSKPKRFTNEASSDSCRTIEIREITSKKLVRKSELSWIRSLRTSMKPSSSSQSVEFT